MPHQSAAEQQAVQACLRARSLRPTLKLDSIMALADGWESWSVQAVTRGLETLFRGREWGVSSIKVLPASLMTHGGGVSSNRAFINFVSEAHGEGAVVSSALERAGAKQREEKKKKPATSDTAV